ncbi:MAG: hypothetical protein JSU88_09755 [Nitrospinaceae bacterium]|jgi:hypothetical protein|nr:MAG: hypothetical protein JSU88_09755 [Nitrospinaceae bacterium]UCD33439.1 MAG: hypothetical protein JSV38_06110 [Desulfobacterales bacterium]
MFKGLGAKAYYSLRAKGISKEKILELLGTDKEVDEVDRGIVNAYEIFTQIEISNIKKRQARKNYVSDCIASLQKDIDDCDHIHGRFFNEIEKRKIENLSLAELIKYEGELLKMKDRKMDALLKYKNLHIEV